LADIHLTLVMIAAAIISHQAIGVVALLYQLRYVLE